MKVGSSAVLGQTINCFSLLERLEQINLDMRRRKMINLDGRRKKKLLLFDIE